MGFAEGDVTRIVRRQSGRHISRRAEPGSSESFRRSSKGPGVADLVQLVLGHRRMTAQSIPAMAAYSGSHNDLSVPGCSPGQSTSLAHL
jgi:hypothetical protein